MSTMPIVPTPAAARYSAAGEPSPPAPSSRTFEASNLDLTFGADLGQQQVAHVADLLVGAERDRRAPRAALVLPPPEPADHRDDVGVAELLQRAGGERRAHPTGAVDDERCVLVGEPALDLRFEMTAGDVHGAVEGPGVVLVGLADIEHGGAIGDQRSRTRGVDFADLRLGGGEQISERGHGLNPTCLVGILLVHGLAATTAATGSGP